MRSPPLLAAWLMLACGAVAAQDVSVEASVDRASIRENESFTYTVRVEGSVRGDPTVTGLSDDFDVLNRSTSTRIQIVNGRTEQVAEWQYQLMPRRAGTFVIEPAQIAGSVSNPIEIEVLAGLPPGDELADIFMEVEAEPDQAYVQAQIIFTLRLFVGIGTGRATLTTPEIGGVEAIVERLGEDANYSTVRGGRNFVVRERRYAVFAQAPGRLTIGPVVFEVMVIPNRGFSRVQRYSSDSVELEVLPAVAPPAEYPQAVWLPAQRVALSERWSEDPDSLEMGIPRTRALTIEADGLLETQLPDLRIVQADGIRQYADQPDLDRSVDSDGLTVQRTERYAVIAQRAGSVELPAVELPWWNVTTRQWEVARIEPRTVEVAPSTEAVAPVTETQPEAPVRTETVVEYSPAGWWLAAVFGCGWLLTAVAWWYTARRASRASRAVDGRGHGSARAALTRLQRACAVSDADAARDALLDWASREATFSDCTSLGALADELPAEAAGAVRDLERHLYSAGAGDWDGGSLAICVPSLRKLKDRSKTPSGDPLPSLYS
ncbi:MAG: BatD family protein [Gammaproteobacteria bacterium]|jgi:hypothetical protein